MTDNKIQYLAEEFRSHAELFKTLATKMESTGVLETIERDLVLDIFKKSYASVLLFGANDNIEDKNVTYVKTVHSPVEKEEETALFSTSELESAFSKPFDFEGNPFETPASEEIVLDIDFEKEAPAEEPETTEIKKQEPEIQEEKAPVIEIITAPQEEVEIPQKAEEPKIEPVAKKKSLAEQFNYPPALHEALAKVVANKNLSTVLASRPIANLASGITLNDKYLFIRELFEGNSAKYEDLISQIDNSHSLSEGIHIVGRSIENVDFESGAAHKFIELIHRRFSGY